MWLLKGVRGGVSSPLTVTDSRIVRYFDEAWLRKATDIVEGGERM
jgi:FlaA1/EpsC-like NDP-sugar epimerase